MPKKIQEVVSSWNPILDEIDNINVLPTEELQQEFITRTKKHIALVNKYAEKISMSFPSHDNSKLNELALGYCFFSKPEKERTPDENRLLDIVTLIHIKNAAHHPEFWTDSDLTGFTRKNFTPNGVIDATDMPDDAIKEMLCDWCSCSEEFGNSPFEWFSSVNGTRWLFNESQQRLILETLKILWD